MFKSNKIKIFSLSFILSFFIIFYSKNFTSPEKTFSASKSFRKLFAENEIQEICEKSDSSITSKFFNLEFAYEVNNKNKWADYIIEFLRTEESSEFAKKYYKRVLPFLVFIILPIILVFFWIGYCCCCCCPCCCCRQKGKENCCRFFSFLIALIMNGIVIVGCVYGLATTKKFVKSMNETTCVVMKTYLHVTKGDDYNGKPKWEGSSTIQEILNGIIENLDEINQLAIGLSENKENLDEQYENFKVFSQTKEEGIDQLKVTNPNVFDTSIDKVKPIYAFNREDKIKDLNSFIEQIVDSVDSLTKQVESLKDSENIRETKSKLNDAINKIQDITSEFTDNEDVLNDWVKYQKDFNKYSNKTSYFIFIFIAGLAIISLFLSLFLVGQVCFFFPKLFLHIIWNINQILLIIIFLLGSFLGIIGVLLTDGVDVFNYAISEENLNENNNDPILFKSQNTNEYINKCFNGDGNIIQNLNIKTNEIDSLDSAFHSYENFSNLTSEVIMESFEQFNDYYTNFKNNLNNMSYFIHNDSDIHFVNSDLEEFEKYTNHEKSGNYQKNDSEKNFNHVWKFYYDEDNYKCPFIQTSEFKEENACFNIKDYENIKNDLNEYEKCNVNNLYNNLKNASDIILPKFYDFYNDCNEQLNNIININDQYQSHLKNISKTANISLEYAQNITNILHIIFSEYINEDNYILDIINCKFLGRDKNLILFELDGKFTSNVTKMATDILTIACAMALGTFFLLIVINRYKKDKKNENKTSNKKVEEKKEISNSSGVIENDDSVENI